MLLRPVPCPAAASIAKAFARPVAGVAEAILRPVTGEAEAIPRQADVDAPLPAAVVPEVISIPPALLPRPAADVVAEAIPRHYMLFHGELLMMGRLMFLDM